MRSIPLLLLAAVLACAADKGPATAQAANGAVALTATLYTTRDEVRGQLGSDLGGYFIVVKVDLSPRGDKPLNILRDDFLLRSYKDGQKSQPFAPTQIAGRGALVLGSAGGGGGFGREQGGPVWGPGPGMGGPPSRLPGQDGGFGSTTADTSSAQARVSTGGGPQKDDPVLAVLKEKILPEKKTGEPVSGLLYFSLEGKHKPKDLVLQYATPAGKLQLTFK
ncbi:MAG: hypothetical protein ACM336_09940 [Acidobacteriota bacterium]